MKLNIRVDSAEVERAYRRAPERVTRYLREWVEEVAAEVEREAKQAVPPRVDTGNLQDSIQTFFSPNRLNARVEPRAKYALWVHEGRDPGTWPPFHEGSALWRWSNKKGIEPFLVARAIKQKGTEGHPFMEEAHNKVKPYSNRKATIALNKIVRAT